MQAVQRISEIDFGHFEEALRCSILFESVKTDVISEFLSMSSVLNFKKNDIIYNLEDKAEWFYLINDGWVKLSRETLNGEEAILDVLGKDEVFAENTMFENFRYTANATAVEDTEVIRLPLGFLANSVEGDSELAMSLLKCSTSKLSSKNKEIEHLSVKNAPQKIGCFLLRLCNHSKEEQSLHLPFDKILIAAKLGMKPETFSRALLKLKDETGISVDGRNFKIPALSNLSQYSCSSCSSQFPCGA